MLLMKEMCFKCLSVALPPGGGDRSCSRRCSSHCHRVASLQGCGKDDSRNTERVEHDKVNIMLSMISMEAVAL